MKIFTILFFSTIVALETVSACRPDCWAEKLGYPCCEPTNDNIISIDEQGNEWGIENGKQCGILVYDINMKGCGGKKEPQECDPNDCFNVMAIGEDGTLWGISSTTKTKQKCYMNTEDKTCRAHIQSTCWSALLGYPCCKESHKDLYKDKDGLWAIENGNWCGVEFCSNCKTAEIESIDKYQNIWSTSNNRKCIINKSTAECSLHLNATCRSATLGYMCCKETDKTVYRDSFGFWGIENNKWCGFNDRYPCDYYRKNGYTCCKEITEPVEINENGIFGKENGSLCGLPYDYRVGY